MDSGRQTILLADDEADLRENLAMFLRLLGYDVIRAAEGEEAFALAMEHPVSLVITDLSMPGWDGSRLCEELARAPGTESIPVVVLTAWNDRPEVLESKNPRIAGYITKPFRLEEVRRMLDRVFAGDPG